MLTPEQAALKDAVCEDRLMQTVRKIGRYTRLSGSKEELEAFRYVEQKMKEYGYATELLFHDAYVSLPKSAQLTVEGAKIKCITHSYSIPTPPEGVSAQLVYVGTGKPKDYDSLDVAGKFVLVEGLASPGAAAIATKMGALGQVHICPTDHIHEMIVSNVWGNPDDKNLETLPRTHIVSVGRTDGNRLVERLSDAPLHISVKTEVSIGWTPIPLLVADLKASDSDDKYLLLSGHVDSWYLGAMDNGSANATMMEVARLIAEHKASIKRGLRVCFWSGHSHARYAGSAWYADNNWADIRNNCIMHLNVDSTGGACASVLSYATIMEETRGIARWAVGAVTGQRFVGTRISRMGDQSFWGIGVPSMFVGLSEQPPDPGPERAPHLRTPGLGWWWHTEFDTVDKIDPEYLVRDTQVYALVAHSLLTSDVLPFDYAAHAKAWAERFEELRALSHNRFDFDDLIETSMELYRRVERLQNKTQRAEAAEAAVLNDWLMRLGRHLIPVSFSESGPFGQDPALDVPELPDFLGAIRLGALDAESDEAKFIKVRLVRAKNRAMAALSDAIHATSETEKALDSIIQKKGADR